MHTYLLALVFVFLLATAAAGQSVPAPDVELNEVQKLIVASRPLVQANKYDEALVILKRAHDLQPDNDGILAMMGGVYILQQKYQLAAEHVAKAIELNPDESRYYLLKGHVDKFRGSKEDGLIAVRRALAMNSANGDAYYLLEELLAIGGGSIPERTDALRKAVELKPALLETYKWAAYRRNSIQKDPKGAEEAFKIAINVDPNKMAGRFDLGRMLVEQGRLKEARELWNGRTSDEDNTFPNFIVVLERAEKLEAAKAAYEKNPKDPEVILQMGTATMDGDHWVVDGRQEKAIEFFRKALEIRPDFAKAQYAICKAYVQIADTYKSKNKELNEELAKLRGMDAKLADEIVEYRNTYKGGLQALPPPPSSKKP